MTDTKVDIEAVRAQSMTNTNIDIEALRDLIAQPYTPKFNPGPLGLSAFAMSTFVASVLNLGVGFPAGSPVQIITGLAIFYGGGVQTVAGLLEFYVGNTLSATTLISYGAFWLSYGAILIPSFGIAEALATAPGHTAQNALGVYLLGWTIYTMLIWLGTLRTSKMYSLIWAVLFFNFLFLTIGDLAHLGANNIPTRIAGGFGIIASFLAWYCCAALLYTPKTTFITLPVGLH
ncbi:hypothetical protein BGZ46_009480 [Entomortierella lignicola]|nr:hypothetical protein BGZ46_009480 [Entomortierella lignicola]